MERGGWLKKQLSAARGSSACTMEAIEGGSFGTMRFTLPTIFGMWLRFCDPLPFRIRAKLKKSLSTECYT